MSIYTIFADGTITDYLHVVTKTWHDTEAMQRMIAKFDQ